MPLPATDAVEARCFRRLCLVLTCSFSDFNFVRAVLLSESTALQSTIFVIEMFGERKARRLMSVENVSVTHAGRKFTRGVKGSVFRPRSLPSTSHSDNDNTNIAPAAIATARINSDSNRDTKTKLHTSPWTHGEESRAPSGASVHTFGKSEAKDEHTSENPECCSFVVGCMVLQYAPGSLGVLA